jgi:hypothetical protein
MNGVELSREGAAALPSLYPDRKDWPTARRRLRRRYRAFLGSGDHRLMDVGFFLYGVAEAMKGGRHA